MPMNEMNIYKLEYIRSIALFTCCIFMEFKNDMVIIIAMKYDENEYYTEKKWKLEDDACWEILIDWCDHTNT